MERIPGAIRHDNRKNPLPRAFYSIQQIVNKKRPQSSHGHVYYSKGYRLLSADTKGKNLSTIQINQETYYTKKDSIKIKKPENVYNFIKYCQDEGQKQNKIRKFVKKASKLQKNKIDLEPENVDRLVNFLQETNPFFYKINETLIKQIAKQSKIKVYGKQHIIQSDQIGEKLGIVLYGKGKLKNRDFSYRFERSDVIGDHTLFNRGIQFEVKFTKQSAILWFSLKDFNEVKKNAMIKGFRQQFNLLSTQFRMNFVKKRFPR